MQQIRPAKWRTILRKTLVAGVFLAAFVALVSLQAGVNLFAEFYYDHFGLNGKSTVADFRAASATTQAHFLKSLCNDGVCLHSIDWKCGFSTSADPYNEFDTGWMDFNEGTRECFISLVRKAPPNGFARKAPTFMWSTLHGFRRNP